MTMIMEACAILSSLLFIASASEDARNATYYVDVTFPWLVKILSYNWGLVQLNWSVKCTGTYINEWWVLSAASCVIADRTHVPPTPYNLVELYMGFTHTSHSVPQKRKAILFSVHPEYVNQPEGNIDMYSYNLVLIRPEERFAFNELVQVDKNWNKEPGNTRGRQSSIVGFGFGEGHTFPDELQETNITEFEKNVKGLNTKLEDMREFKTVIICYGDIGGPLYWGVAQVGVATRYEQTIRGHQECGLGLYTNIRHSEIYSWLRIQIKNVHTIANRATSKNVLGLCNLLRVAMFICTFNFEIKLNI